MPAVIKQHLGLASAGLESIRMPVKKELAVRLNLGCGNDILPAYVNHDVRQHRPEVDVVHDLRVLPWPWPSHSADEIRLLDVLEHMPAVVPVIDECWRLLKPGGLLHVRVPHYQHENAWLDPTHVRPFHLDSFDYFDPDRTLGSKYGFYSERKWKILRKEIDHDGNVAVVMRPHKEVALDSGDFRGYTEEEMLALAKQELAAVIPAGARVIPIQWDYLVWQDLIPGRSAVPFIERDGRYWGPPADDQTAIQELERLRLAEVGYMIVVWSAFWWLECYPDFFAHVRANYRCLLETDRLLVFQLRP
jgi:SAM-dependent methyltransferase